MRRFIRVALLAVLGGLSGAFVTWILWQSVSPGSTLPGAPVIGGLIGVIGALSWETVFVIPITGAGLGGVVGGAAALWLLAADARTQHRSMGDTAYEGAALLLIYGAAIGAAMGCIAGVSVVKRWVARNRGAAEAEGNERGEQ